MSWAVVVPTPSTESDQYKRFSEAWAPIFEKHQAAVYAIEGDAPDAPDWIPRHNDQIRSWGFYKAWRDGCDPILTLDDDTRPMSGRDIFDDYDEVFSEGAVLSDYLDVGALTNSRCQMRGFPKRDRAKVEVAVQYGGWNGVLDFDAETQLSLPRARGHIFYRLAIPVPRGCAATCCSMNMAFRREYTPIVWQLPLLEGRYARWGDIWAGLLAKATLDVVGKAMVINGRASVLHNRQSDPRKSLEIEALGLSFNEGLWDSVRSPADYLYAYNPETAYVEATHAFLCEFRRKDAGYADHFEEARDEWLALFAKPSSSPATTKTQAGWDNYRTAGSRS